MLQSPIDPQGTSGEGKPNETLRFLSETTRGCDLGLL